MARQNGRRQRIAARAPNETSAHPAHKQRVHAAPAPVLAELRRLEQLFATHGWREQRTFLAARRRARQRVLELLEADAPLADVKRLALLVAASELLVALELEGSATTEDLARLCEQVEGLTGISAIALAREALRAPELLSVSPAQAIEGTLAMLLAFGPVRSVSLWTLGLVEHPTCMRHVGEGEPSRRARQLAQLMLSGDDVRRPTSARSELLVLPVGRWKHPLGALVASARPSMQERARAFLEAAVLMLGPILERELLTSANAASERALVQASERKLTRLGFDLHDGPIQDVAVLAQDVRLFREQLERVMGPLGEHGPLGGRIEDLEGQLDALDSQLRRLSGEVQAASVLLDRPFERALRDRTQVFMARTGIQPRVKLRGDMHLVSASQQIALLNIVQEALNNVREHANATKVEIRLSADERRVEAQVIDNGDGFDLESTLMRTAREGRVGLVSMNERVRLLGGQCRIESRPGGPTVVSVTLERWQPVPQDTRARRASVRR